MIVDAPPYELVMVFADADMQRFAERLVERGQERRCLRTFRWRILRDPHRDSMVAAPEGALEPLYCQGDMPRVILMWDHAGSGRELDSPVLVEDEVIGKLVSRGWSRERLAAIAVVPELEAVLEPVWEAVKGILAEKRGAPVPPDPEVLRQASWILRRRRSPTVLPEHFSDALRGHPKELLHGLVSLLNLRVSPEQFAYLGSRISIPDVKGGCSLPRHNAPPCPTSVAGRLSSVLQTWFPGEIPW